MLRIRTKTLDVAVFEFSFLIVFGIGNLEIAKLGRIIHLT